MADTRCQLEVEDWVRREWLPARFGQEFRSSKLRLLPGGKFEFDAVSADGTIVATISTSAAWTVGGKRSTGAIMKHRSDMLFLLMARAAVRLLVLTEDTMYTFWEAQQRRGRVPTEIEVVLARLPSELQTRLVQARARSSAEMLQALPSADPGL